MPTDPPTVDGEESDSDSDNDDHPTSRRLNSQGSISAAADDANEVAQANRQNAKRPVSRSNALYQRDTTGEPVAENSVERRRFGRRRRYRFGTGSTESISSRSEEDDDEEESDEEDDEAGDSSGNDEYGDHDDAFGGETARGRIGHLNDGAEEDEEDDERDHNVDDEDEEEREIDDEEDSYYNMDEEEVESVPEHRNGFLLFVKYLLNFFRSFSSWWK